MVLIVVVIVLLGLLGLVLGDGRREVHHRQKLRDLARPQRQAVAPRRWHLPLSCRSHRQKPGGASTEIT